MNQKLRSDFTQIEDVKAKEHPAFAAFAKEMEGRQYGHEPLNSAWYWFRDGWDAASIKKPKSRILRRTRSS